MVLSILLLVFLAWLTREEFTEIWRWVLFIGYFVLMTALMVVLLQIYLT